MIDKIHGCVKRKEKWADLAHEAFEASKKRKYFADVEKRLLEKLKEASENKNSSGGDFMFIKYERQGSVDYKKIPALKDINLDIYRKEDVTSWKLSKI